MSTVETVAYEFKLYEIPLKRFNPQAPEPDRMIRELNEFGAVGWMVVASLESAHGITHRLLLQRPIG